MAATLQPVSGAVARMGRPDAPLDLAAAEADEWSAIVETMPAGWFSREMHPLLAQYCRHVVTARRVAQLVDAEMARAEIDLHGIDKLLAMQARETGTLKALATSMRLTQQSGYTARGAGGVKARRPMMPRPWEWS